MTCLVATSVWVSYLGIYLPLKRRSPTNTFLGAIVGALPPFIGTCAFTGTLIDLPTFLLAGYIFSWQYPHFYGILYENKDDYKRAGFNMISNLDPSGKRAYRHMMACNTVNTILPLAMCHTMMIHPSVLAPFLASQVYSFKAIHRFKKESGSRESAKQVKRSSYIPFMILLLGFYGTTLYDKVSVRLISDKNNFMTELGVTADSEEVN